MDLKIDSYNYLFYSINSLGIKNKKATMELNRDGKMPQPYPKFPT